MNSKACRPSSTFPVAGRQLSCSESDSWFYLTENTLESMASAGWNTDPWPFNESRGSTSLSPCGMMRAISLTYGI